MTVIHTACTHDCPDACGLRVTLEGGRAVRLQGQPEHPITRGRLCYRVHHQLKRLHHAERLDAPLLRGPDGRWTEVSWEQALERCAHELQQTLQQHGPQAVLHLSGGGSLGLRKQLVGHFFHSLGPITTLAGGVCGEAGEAAQSEDFGSCACHDYTDLAHSRAVVLWGKNPAASGVHLVPFVAQARRRGCPVWLVDPAPAESARLADQVVCVAPGGDGALALGMLRWLLDRGLWDAQAQQRAEGLQRLQQLVRQRSPERWADRAGVSPAALQGLARLYGTTRPLATWIGWGLQRSRVGGHSVRCIDALCLLTGQVGLAGGGANFTSCRSRGLDRSRLAQASGRRISAPRLAQQLDSLERPEVRFIYINGANPVTQYADSAAMHRALRRPGRFVVLADAFMTDTAQAADLVLPVTLMLEDLPDVVGSYQHHHVARVRPAAAPPPGARHDIWIVRQLAARLGRPEDPLLEQPERTVEQMTATWFAEQQQDDWARNPHQQPVPFAHRFDTPSGRARLITSEPPDVATSEQYPLTLLSLSSRRWQTSLLPAAQQQGPPTCLVHPDVARRLGLAEGQQAVLRSPLGQLRVQVALARTQHPSACVVHRGGWVSRGRGINLLVQGQPTDLGQGTAFYSQRVRLDPR